MRLDLSVKFALMLAVLSSACAHTRPWHARNLAPCAQGTGDGALDRERSYLALLLALESRHYGVTHAEPHQRVQAKFVSGYASEENHVTWDIRVLADGVVVLDVPPSQREVGKRVVQWADKLGLSLAQYQCRTLDWLRWEAQNRGLVALGAPEASGGELAPPPDPEADARKARLAALEGEYARVKIARSAVFAGIGIVAMAAGGGVLAQGALEQTTDTSDDGPFFMRVGGTMLAAGAVTFGVALPFTLRSLRKKRALGQEMKTLRSVNLTVTGWGLSARGTF